MGAQSVRRPSHEGILAARQGGGGTEEEDPDLAPHSDVSLTTTPGPQPLPDDCNCVNGHKTYRDVLVNQ